MQGSIPAGLQQRDKPAEPATHCGAAFMGLPQLSCRDLWGDQDSRMGGHRAPQHPPHGSGITGLARSQRDHPRDVPLSPLPPPGRSKHPVGLSTAPLSPPGGKTGPSASLSGVSITRLPLPGWQRGSWDTSSLEPSSRRSFQHQLLP